MSKASLSRREFLASIGATVGALGIAGLSSSCSQHSKKTLDLAHGNDPELYPIYDGTKYVMKDFTRLMKDPELGLSPAIIENHLGLYAKYIKKVNRAEVEMRSGDINEFSMKNLAFSLNGMALHDIYFSNMNTDTGTRSTGLSKAIDESYGSFAAYFNSLTTIASQVTGWSITALNLLNGKLINYGTADHSANFPNFIVPILALDVYEHAYAMDFSKDGKERYIQIFSKVIDWDLVSRRYDALQSLLA